MAQVFRGRASQATNVKTEVYTAPSNSVSIINSMYLANNQTGSIIVDIQIENVHDDTALEIYLGYNLEILPHSTLIFDKPITLEADQSLHVTMDSPVNETVEVYISAVDIDQT